MFGDDLRLALALLHSEGREGLVVAIRIRIVRHARGAVGQAVCQLGPPLREARCLKGIAIKRAQHVRPESWLFRRMLSQFLNYVVVVKTRRSL